MGSDFVDPELHNQLRAELDALKADKERAEAELATARQELATLQAKFDALQSEKDALQARFTKMEGAATHWNLKYKAAVRESSEKESALRAELEAAQAASSSSSGASASELAELAASEEAAKTRLVRLATNQTNTLRVLKVRNAQVAELKKGQQGAGEQAEAEIQQLKQQLQEKEARIKVRNTKHSQLFSFALKRPYSLFSSLLRASLRQVPRCLTAPNFTKARHSNPAALSSPLVIRTASPKRFHVFGQAWSRL
jgi:chromosome segregation ATPase